MQTLQHLNSSVHQVTASARDAHDTYTYALQRSDPVHAYAQIQIQQDMQFYMQHLINYCKYIINQLQHLQH